MNGLAPWWSLPPSGLAMDATWLTWHSMIDGWWNPVGLESSETYYFVDGIGPLDEEPCLLFACVNVHIYIHNIYIIQIYPLCP